MAGGVFNSAMLLALAGSAAYAQEASVPDPGADSKLEEVVVTAQRRSEDLQRVPIAITVATAEALERQGIFQPQQLAALAPGLSIGAANGPVTQIYIRGVGTSSANAYSDNAVAFNVDGVYIARNSGLDGQLFDVNRVEVLKGPQGTLYGRNATGGAINVITNNPSLSGLSASGTIDRGNYNFGREAGSVNVPVSDTFAVRVAGQVTRRDGYFSDGYDDNRAESGRLKALYEPLSNLSVLVNLDYAHTGGQGSGSVLRPFVDPSNPWLGPSTAPAQAAFSTRAAPIPLAPPANNGFVDSKSYGASMEVNWDTDFGRLTVLPAYRHLTAQYLDYVPGFLSGVSEGASQRSLEARFATDSTRPVSFIAGTFLFHENRNADQKVDQTVTGSDTQINDLPTDAYAGFGQAQWRVLDSFRLTAGLRYTRENKSLDGRSIARGGAITPLTGDLNFNDVSWRAGAEYDLDAQSMLYANVSTAFKAGGFYTDSAPNNTYRPEKLTAYTLGSKNTLLDGRLRLNGEAFYWDYKDHQESHLAFGAAGIVFKTENVGKAAIKGLESELGLKVGEAGELTARVQYLDAVFDSFAYTSVVPIGAPVTGCAVTRLARPSFRITCDAMPATRAPRWSGNLSYQHNVDIGRYGRLSGTVDVEVASPQYLAIDYVADEHQAGYALTDLSLGYHPPSDRYSVTAWVRNVANRAVLDAASQQLFVPSITLVDLRPPRTFGLTLAAKY